MNAAKKIIVKQLPTAEIASDQQNNIRKVVVVGTAKRAPNYDKVLMLLGATGSGKSTLINGFANYIYGVDYRDDYRYKLIDDEGKQSQAHSQTKLITAYTFLSKGTQERLPFTLTIVDTPGYGDTQGIERDKKITKQIKYFFSLKGGKGIDHIDGVGFVIPASSPRLTPTQKYIFDSILSIFGKDIGKNIFLMVTFADGKKPQVINAIKEQNIEYQQMFKFNNSALLPDEENADHTDDDDDDDDDFNEMFWKMGERSFQNFFGVFGKVQAVSLQLTREVLEERERLECLIEGLQRQIWAGLSKVDQLHQEERILKIHEKDIETNKDFTYTVEETRQRKIDISGQGIYVTNCLTCNMTCHDSCIYAKDEDKIKCSSMNPSGNCNVCPTKCIWNIHKNNSYRFELYTVKVTKTSQELKKRYEEAKGKKTHKEAIMSGLQRDLNQLNNGVLYNILTSRKCLERLDEIALRPNPLSEVQYIDLLIQSEKMEAKQGFLRRVDALNVVRKEAQVLSEIKEKSVYDDFMTNLKTGAAKGWEMIKAKFSTHLDHSTAQSMTTNKTQNRRFHHKLSNK